MKFYDWRKCHVLIDGVKVTGWAAGDDVFGIERRSPNATDEMGADGKMTVSMSADKSVKVDLKLAQTSPMNAILAKVAKAGDSLETFVPVTVTFADSYRMDGAQTTLGYVEKPAPLKRGAKANNVEWTLILEAGYMDLGDPPFAGALTAAAEALGG
jgi:hypothetical protein